MSEFGEFSKAIKNCEDYFAKGRMLEPLLNYFQQGKSVSKSDLVEMRDFLFEEIGILTDLIPTAPDYKTKDAMFYYNDKLLGLFIFTNNGDLTDDKLKKINDLVKTVAKYQVPESAISEMFKLEKITAEDAKKVVEIAMSITDEYQRGMFFQGLLNNKDDIHKFTDDAKTEIANYISSELERYLQKESLSKDEINALEFASDICQYFINDKIISLLTQMLHLPYGNIRYYSMTTLISCNQNIPPEVVVELAHDLTYAELTYTLLSAHNLENMFPKEFAEPEYLAKSDLAHWLTYPTELGKLPDEMVLLGDIKAKGSKYYIFKYKSNSDNLSEDLKNEWLIGWSNLGGGTFSNFDRLCDYEQKNLEKTLKMIKKKLLR